MFEQIIELFWSTLDSPTSGDLVLISYLAEEFFENEFSESRAWRDENSGGIRIKSEPGGKSLNRKIDAMSTEIV